MRKSNIYNAQHPSRQTAIHILESIAEQLGDEGIFDCKNGDTKWYTFEDMVTLSIERIREKDKEKITRRNKQIKDLKKEIKDWESGILHLDEDNQIIRENI